MKKSICLFTNNINTFGGIEKVIAMLSRNLLASGEWDVAIVSMYTAKTETRMSFPADVTFIHGSLTTFDRKTAFRYIKGFLKSHSYDYLVTFHSHISSIVSLLKKKRSSMKWIATEHISMDIYSWKRRLLNLISYSRADKLVVLTDEYRRYYIKHGLKNVVTIVNPLPFEPIDADLSGNHSFIAVARFEPIKRLDLIIQAFSTISSKYPEWSLTIVGDGWLMKKLKEQARDCSIENKVYFAGFQHDVVPFLKQSLAFVISSEYEGLPLACLEALAVGLPIISSELPSIKEVADGHDFVLFFPQGSVEKLSDSMERVIKADDETRNKWRHEITQCIQRYRIDFVMAKWNEILK